MNRPHPQIILASQSPRRKELLEKMGVQFLVIPSNYDEQLDHTRSVEEVAIELAIGKAQAVARQHPDAIVIGSDTIVFADGKQLGKPRDEAEARRVLKDLAGKVNIVATGLAVVYKDKGLEISEVVSSKVFFKDYDREAHEDYLASGDWHDKAGAYGLQSGAARLVDCIEGEYDAILGLPTKTLAAILLPLEFECHAVTLETSVPVRKAA